MTAGPAAFRAFGQPVALETTGDRFLEEDSRWRLREVYEPALAGWSLPATGHAVDLGAGFGAFALPFALAWPGWRVTCIEADAEAHATLCRNIERLGLSDRVTARRAALVGDGVRDATSDGATGDTATLLRNRRRRGFLSADRTRWRRGARAERFPALSAASVPELNPDLLKITMPGQETAVLEAFAGTPPAFVLGECWDGPPPGTSLGRGTPSVYMPLAGTPWHLSRGAPPDGLHHGLDIVVAMYNSADTIVECVESLLADAPAEQRVLVVDDGSTDASAEIVGRHFGDHPQLHLVRKENGGCASARNRGRMMSDRAHIAFVDADDMTDPGFFAALLELARCSGKGAVQGAFQAFRDGPSGRVFEPRPEGEAFGDRPRHPFFTDAGVVDLPWADVVTGQPTIWRRVYRRDFLDANDIWFPEHIRAFDDQIFQMLSAYHSGTIPARDDLRYLYRQHPGQDIRQGDERAFYSLEMYRLVLRRAVAEGWPNFAPFVTSYFNTLKWCHDGLRPDLRARFLAGGAELWVYMQKVFGAALAPVDRSADLPGEFAREAHAIRCKLDGFGDSYAFAYLDGPRLHVDMVRAMEA